MAKKQTDGAQNIDGVLEQLKQSYSADAKSVDDIIDNESASEDVSHDELQARLRSQFLSDEAKSVESSDDYSIDEEFLKDAYDNGEITETSEATEIQNEEKGNEYEYDEAIIEEDKEDALEKADDEEDQEIEKAEVRQGYQEEYQENEEISAYEGSQALQEEEYNEAAQEIYEEEKDQEIQESDSESIQINVSSEKVYIDEEDDDDSLWNEDENYIPITFEDVEDEADDELSFEMVEDTRTAAEISEDNYVDVFYRSNEQDPYENMSFKERISENAPTVDSLEAELVDMGDDDFTLEEFDEAKSIPLMLDDDGALLEEEQTEEKENNASSSAMEELDRSDLALLLEFGYTEEILQNVSDEKIEELSDDELMDDILQENISEAEDFEVFDVSNSAENSTSASDDQALADFEEAEQDEKKRFEKLKNKINKQYDGYRKKRGGILLKFIISAVLTLVLLVYEIIPLLGVDVGGVFDRDRYFFAYVLVGLQLLILAVLPAVKDIFESFKRVLSKGIDAYVIAGTSFLLTVIYDFIAVFSKDPLTTFHFCAALVVAFAQLSELMKITTEIRNYEYYFSEYIFDGDMTEVEKFKFTLVKSEGRGSIAEKMYQGGLNENTSVYFSQNVESVSGFFEANKIGSKRNKATFGWVIASIVVALIFTIVSGIIYDGIWVAPAAFLITFNLMMPITAIITEWLPFERLSKQNYAYGAAFASEGSIEALDKCDIIVFNDMHIFEKCNAKTVNLAIYDSTSKETLLSCLNAVYGEIGGPLQSALASRKTQSLGECKINRVAKSGVEALVGTSYSVLIGDEQFMSRYGIYFPKAALGKEEDKIFTLCVSINNRATARIAVKYKINETFYSILQKLLEDNIYCAVQTYDPMINAELIARVRPFKGVPVNVVHKNSSDFELEQHQHKSGALYAVSGEELSILARGSRLNLAVAISNAKKIRKLRIFLNICSGAILCVGALTALMLVLSEKLMTVSWLFVFVYWLISGAVTAGLMIWKFPQKDRFIFNKK